MKRKSSLSPSQTLYEKFSGDQVRLYAATDGTLRLYVLGNEFVGKHEKAKGCVRRLLKKLHTAHKELVAVHKLLRNGLKEAAPPIN